MESYSFMLNYWHFYMSIYVIQVTNLKKKLVAMVTSKLPKFTRKLMQLETRQCIHYLIN